CNRQLSMEPSSGKPLAGARAALWLLLGINLFNYIDRQILAAVEPEIRATFFSPNDPNAMARTGALGTAFLVTYMMSAPALGWLSCHSARSAPGPALLHQTRSARRRRNQKEAKARDLG